MSFNFFNDGGGNEGDDTDDDLDLDAYDDTGLLALASRRQAGKKSSSASPSSLSSSPVAAAATAAAASGYDGAVGGTDDDAQSNEEDWDDIDWEDADQDEHVEEDAPSFPTRGVVINIGKRVGKSNHPEEEDALRTKISHGKKDEEEHPNLLSSKKRKRNRVRVLKNVPRETQQMILNIRRTQLLCNVVRSVQCSLAACGGSSIRGDLDSDDDDYDRMLLAHVAYSIIPQEFHHDSASSSPTTTQSDCHRSTNYTIPTKHELHKFSQWCFQFLNGCGERRRATLQRNVAHGAAAASSSTTSRQRIRKLPANNRKKQSTEEQKRGAMKENSISEIQSSQNQVNESSHGPTSTNPHSDLLRKVMYLSPHYDEDPQLLLEEEEGGVVDAIDAVEGITDHDKALIFLTMARLLGWRARYVTSFHPMPLELTVDHPLLNASSTLFKSSSSKSTSSLHPDVIKLFRFMHEQSDWMGNESTSNNLGRKKRPISKMVANAKEVRTIGTLKDSFMNSAHNPDDCSSNSLSWVEILCHKIGTGKPNSNCNSTAMWVPILPAQESFDKPEDVESILAWMEVEGEKSKGRCDMDGTPMRKERKGSKSKSPTKQWHPAKTSPVSYVLAVEHVALPLKSSTNLSSDSDYLTQQLKGVRLTDVTPRYANTWSRTLRLRGASGKEIAAGGGRCVDQWWSESLKRMNAHCASKSKPQKSTIPLPCSVTKSKSSTGKAIDVIELESSDESDADEHEQAETMTLAVDIKTQKIPTSKAQFKQSPFFVIPSVLNSTEVLHPNARERICGVFKGELVYRRSDVSKALRATKWLYQGRKVKEVELSNPVKQIKAKKRTAVKGFTALSSYGTSEEAQEINLQSMNFESEGDSDLVNLYSVWQTDPWSPPYVGPNDEIPTNAYKNVELALINPGLTHLDQPRLAPIARKLGIPYSPCMLGFEGHGGNRTPTIRGIVVHEHNAALIREAAFEWESHTAEKEIMEKHNEIVKRWKRLVVGMLMKERLDREYG